MKYSIFILIIFIGCKTSIVSPLDPSNNEIINKLCNDSCDNRLKLKCLEEKLIVACLPTCYKTTAVGLFDPRLSAIAQNRDQMIESGIRCQ